MKEQKEIINGLLIIILSIVFFYVIAIDFHPKDDTFVLFMNLCLLIAGITRFRDGTIQFSHSRKKIDAVTASIEEEYKECSACHGKGSGYFSCCSGEIVDEDVAMCPECYEHLGEEECELCDGTGTIN